MNQWNIIGTVASDPVLKTTKTGKDVVNFRVAVRKRAKAKDNEHTCQFIDVTAWDGLARICSQYMKRKQHVFVTGSAALHLYQAKDGTQRATLAIEHAERVEFVGRINETNEGVDQYAGAAPLRDVTADKEEPEDEFAGFTEVDLEEELPF